MEIKSPWTIVYTEMIDEFISFIKENIPPKHELQSHDLFPGIKLSGQPIFIVDDDTTGKSLLIDFVNMKPWGKADLRVPTIKYFESDEAVQEMIDQDHQRENDQ